MNKILTAIVIMFSCGVVFAGDPVPAKPHQPTPEELRERQDAFNKLSKEEQAKVVAERKEKMLMRTGGRIRDTRNQRGKIVVANGQKTIAKDVFTGAVEKFAASLCVAVEVVDVDAVNLDDAAKTMQEKKADVLLFVGELDKPVMSLVAPEERWAVVNVKKLGDKNVESRLRKEIMRTLSQVCGANMSQFANPLSQPIVDARSLDVIPVEEMPIDVLNRVKQYLNLVGVIPYEEVYYRTACEQGWAPKPENKYQQAVWDRVHALPTEPIKISPESKK